MAWSGPHCQLQTHMWLPRTWSQLCTGFVLNPEPAHGPGIEPFPRVTQGLIYVGPASSEVWLGNDKRLRGRREEESESRRERREEGSQAFDCSPEDGRYISHKIYPLQRSSRESSLLGSLFVDPTVPDSSWHVEIRTEQIEFHL